MFTWSSRQAFRSWKTSHQEVFQNHRFTFLSLLSPYFCARSWNLKKKKMHSKARSKNWRDLSGRHSRTSLNKYEVYYLSFYLLTIARQICKYILPCKNDLNHLKTNVNVKKTLLRHKSNGQKISAVFISAT